MPKELLPMYVEMFESFKSKGVTYKMHPFIVRGRVMLKLEFNAISSSDYNKFMGGKLKFLQLLEKV